MRSTQPEGEDHGGQQEEEPHDEKDDQGCLGSLRPQLPAKEIEMLLAGPACGGEGGSWLDCGHHGCVHAKWASLPWSGTVTAGDTPPGDLVE